MFGFGKKAVGGFSDDDIRQIQEAFSMFDAIIESGLISEVMKRFTTLLKEGSKDLKPVLEDFSDYSIDQTVKAIKAYKEKLDIPIELAASIYVATCHRNAQNLQNLNLSGNSKK